MRKEKKSYLFRETENAGDGEDVNVGASGSKAGKQNATGKRPRTGSFVPASRKSGTPGGGTWRPPANQMDME